jgi:hypothetical protein
LKFKKGDIIICLQDKYTPRFSGTMWIVEEVAATFYLCHALEDQTSTLFRAFRESEIEAASPLHLELL